MLKFRFVAASLSAVAIVVLTPVSAFADCTGCFSGCLDAYGDDNSESGYHALSQCFNACTDDNGFPCMSGV